MRPSAARKRRIFCLISPSHRSLRQLDAETVVSRAVAEPLFPTSGGEHASTRSPSQPAIRCAAGAPRNTAMHDADRVKTPSVFHGRPSVSPSIASSVVSHSFSACAISRSNSARRFSAAPAAIPVGPAPLNLARLRSSA